MMTNISFYVGYFFIFPRFVFLMVDYFSIFTAWNMLGYSILFQY